MADNFITRFANRVADRFTDRLVTFLTPERVDSLNKNRKYYEGMQARPLKTKIGQADDNLVTNFVNLAVSRSNSMLFGGGVDFIVPEGGESDKGQWLDRVWRVNKKNILLHRTGLDGELYGTWYMKILPDAIEADGAAYPRLVLLDTTLMAVETDPMDIERVVQYIFEMKLESEDTAIREITRRTDADGEIIVNEFGLQESAPSDTWLVETWQSDRRSSNWKLLSSKIWPYPFPPIHHCQNLPSVHSVYGTDGLGGGLDVQDKYNFVTSNILKIIRYHAHPKTWGRGFPSTSGGEKVSWGSDELIKFTGDSATIQNLEMQSDLSSSRNIAQDLRQTIFDLARVVDIASITDKVGALTNFGLRVLYGDALSKNSTRRELYGDALVEINSRMLTIAGFDGANEIAWGSDLPQDEREDAELILKDLAAGIVSQETASTKRGYVWKTTDDGLAEGEQAKIASDKAAGNNTADAALARLFAGNEVP